MQQLVLANVCLPLTWLCIYFLFSHREQSATRGRLQHHLDRTAWVQECLQWHARQVAVLGNLARPPLSIGNQDPVAFSQTCFRLEQSPSCAIQVNSNCLFKLPGDEHGNEQLCPFEAIQQHQGLIRAYFGITGQLNDSRLLQNVARVCYDGNKDAAIADGRRCHVLWRISDMDFLDRM